VVSVGAEMEGLLVGYDVKSYVEAYGKAEVAGQEEGKSRQEAKLRSRLTRLSSLSR